MCHEQLTTIYSEADIEKENVWTRPSDQHINQLPMSIYFLVFKNRIINIILSPF